MKNNKIFALLVLFVCLMSHLPQAMAGICFVTTETDTSSDTGALRGNFESVINHQLSNCFTQYSGTGNKTVTLTDFTHFDQRLSFETTAYQGSVKDIVLSSSISVKPNASIVVGNMSLNVLTDPQSNLSETRNFMATAYTDAFLLEDGSWEESLGLTFYGYAESYVKTYLLHNRNEDNTFKDYGHVVINSSQTSEPPFKCLSGAKNVYLRNLVLVTKGYSKTTLFSGTGDFACLRDAGAVKVCNTKTHNYHADEDPFTSSSWCQSKWVLAKNPNAFVPPVSDNCTEEEKIAWIKDGDGDGYGRVKNLPRSIKHECDQPLGYVNNNDDCDDSDSTQNPGVTELCSDGIDNNCNGSFDCEDEACVTDSFCSGSTENETTCADGADNDNDGATDCADADCQMDSTCTGNETETSCDDGLDNDADGGIDCQDEDCDDEEICDVPGPGPTPAPVENCFDQIDNDTDGAVDCADRNCDEDDACAEVDNDKDGYTPAQNDCDDHNADINPGAKEMCDDDKDNNCDNVIDEAGCTPSVNPPVTPPVSGGADLEGNGCSCNLRAKAPAGSRQMLLAAMLALPMLWVLWFRQKLAARQN